MNLPRIGIFNIDIDHGYNSYSRLNNEHLLKLTFHCFYCYSHFNTQNFVFVGSILF